MKSVNKNTKLNERFRSNETVEKASLDEITYSFLYEDDNNFFHRAEIFLNKLKLKKYNW